MPRKPRKQADRIRSLLDQGKSYSDVERRLGVSNAAVWQADQHRRPVGRPPVGLPKERITVYVKGVTSLRLRDDAAERRITLGESIDELAVALRRQEPPPMYSPCPQCGQPAARLALAELPEKLEALASELCLHRLDDREMRAHDSRVSSSARITLASLLDRLQGYCIDCEPWMRAMKTPTVRTH